MRGPDDKGFLGSLFDFGFDSLITTKIIRVLYALVVVIFSIGAVILVISGIASGQASGFIFGIILVPIGYLIYLSFARIWMEVLIVVFRIGDDVHAIRMGGGGFGPGAPPRGPAPGGPAPAGPYSGVPPAGGFRGGPAPGGPPPVPPVPPAPNWPPR